MPSFFDEGMGCRQLPNFQFAINNGVARQIDAIAANNDPDDSTPSPIYALDLAFDNFLRFDAVLFALGLIGVPQRSTHRCSGADLGFAFGWLKRRWRCWGV